MTKILRALALASACACSVNAQVIFPGGSGATIGSYTVATLPATSTVGTLAIVTDASTAGSCTAGGGTALSLCRWSGAAWTTVGGSGGSGTVINTYLVSTLPASPTTNTLAVVTDSSPTGSCTAGGGSGHALCQYTGSAWVTVAPVSVGSGTAGQVAGYSATGNVIAGETIVNDTNVTAAISGGNFTIGWSGTLAKARLLTTVVYADQSNTWSAGTQNFSSAAHTLPAVTVAASGSLPAMCTAGEIAFVTGATAGQNIYECGSTNTWTQQLNSGGGGSPISGATTNALVTAASSTTIQTPSATATMDSSGNISTAGGIITGVGSSVAGHEAYGAGTAFTAPTSSVGFQAPSSVTTKFMMTLPAAPVTGLMLSTGTTDPTTIAFVAPAANKVIGGATPSAITVTSAYVDNSIALTGTDINTSNQVTGTHLSSALPVNQGGTNCTSPTITCFNNITGFTAAGTTGTTSTNLVFSTSPTLITPALGTPSALVLTNAIGLPLSGLATQAADTIAMNASGSTASPTAVAMPTCTSGANLYNTTTHAWSCVSTGGTVTHQYGGAFGAAGGPALTTGMTTYAVIPQACTINGYNILVDAGTATVKFWKIATGTAIPTVSNSISTSGVSISTGTALHSSTTSDFTTTTVTANDIVAVNITTISGVAFLYAAFTCQ